MKQNAIQRLFVLSVFFIFLASYSFAILDFGQVKIFAVTEDEKGMAADLYLYKISGNGDVAFITSNSLVGKDTQTTGNIALDIAEKQSKVKRGSNNYIFDIRANASEVDGPSAGAAMTLLAYSILSERALPKDVGITGTINTDGSVGVVGGVYQKALAASQIGIKLLMIPRGEANQVIREEGKVQSINLIMYAPENLGMKVVEVSTIVDVLEYAYANVSEIKVPETTIVIDFIPEAIKYKKALEPMKKISIEYITRAKDSIEEAKKELETTLLDDSLRSEFYPQLGVAERNIEMSQIFLDQNYLYSAANYSFNAKVLAGTIAEIAKNPSLLEADSTILSSKISSLKQELSVLKYQLGFIPLDKVEWIIAAQQRVAYAENALEKIAVSKENASGKVLSTDEVKGDLFERVYEFVSAQLWVEVSGDFLGEAKKSSWKKEPYYSDEFANKVESKLGLVKRLIDDSNVSADALDESQRRYNAAVISLDNNFYFAALYDAYFAESFILSEKQIEGKSAEELVLMINKIHSDNVDASSIFGNLFYDHSIFFLENSKYDASLNKANSRQVNLETSFDLAYLSTQIELATDEVESYLSSATLLDYSQNEPIIDITYNQGETNIITIYFYVLVFLFSLLLVVLVIVGFKSGRGRRGLNSFSRAEKVSTVLNRLDKALNRKNISEAEYFFMKKKYEDEYKRVSSGKEREKISLNLDESRAKLRALEKGLLDLDRHYKAGLIIPEDHQKQSLEVRDEIKEIKLSIKEYQKELRFSRREWPKRKSQGFVGGLFSVFRDEPVKGTEELAREEEKQEKNERAKRRKLVKSR